MDTSIRDVLLESQGKTSKNFDTCNKSEEWNEKKIQKRVKWATGCLLRIQSDEAHRVVCAAIGTKR